MLISDNLLIFIAFDSSKVTRIKTLIDIDLAQHKPIR